MFAGNLFPAAITVEFVARILRVDGTIVVNVFDISAGASGGQASATVNLVEGFLLSITARMNSNAVRGQVYTAAFLKRPSLTTNPSVLQLFADYCTVNIPCGFPAGRSIYPTEGPGNVRQITGTTPAAGAEINEVVPSSTRWRVVAFTFSLVTSATVANRTTSSPNSKLQPASTTITFVGTPGGTFTDDLIASPAETIVLTMPPSHWLETNGHVRTNTLNIQAGDQYSAPLYYVEEWVAGI
jgi:hypothetical protein